MRRMIERATTSVAVLLACAAAAGAVGACSSSPTSSTSASAGGPPTRPAGSGAGTSTAPTTRGNTSGSSSGSSSPLVEVHPPGDIPDNQAFVPFTGSGFSIRVPEGWSRTTRSGATTFSDKYNSIAVTVTRAAAAPTVTTVRTSDLPTVRSRSRGYRPGPVTSVQRTAGRAILARYQAFSAVNPVTGKVALEAVERYVFWRGGREVVLTLSAPVGSDNVDPWRKVTDSFTWTGAA